MGGALHRLQVLLVGCTLLFGGAVVVILIYVRPPAQPAYLQVTPLPVVPAAPTDVARPTPARPPAPVSTPALPARPLDAPAPLVAAARWLESTWPGVLVIVGGMLLLVAVWRALRRRRMAYTGQSIGMLLAASDAQTRAANVRVLRALHDQGHLPAALAAAAVGRVRFRWPPLRLPSLRVPALPRLRMPALWRPPVVWPRLPQIRVPRLRLPQVRAIVPRRSLTPAPMLDYTPLPALPTDPEGRSVLDETAPEDSAHAEAAAPGSAAGEEGEDTVAGASSAPPWSAEDRALTVAGALVAAWREHDLSSPVLALDTSIASGAGLVTAVIEAALADEERLLAMPAHLAERFPGWQAAWSHQGGRAQLTIDLPGRGTPPPCGPLLAPLITHGRRERALRFLPLDIWRHLGLYGEGALASLHALLAGMLYAQSPRDLALAFCDAGQVSALYAGIAHLVPAPGGLRACCDALREGARRATARQHPRPLLLVVVEPDGAMLTDLAQLLSRLRGRPEVPLHVLVAQERVLEQGRELYALLPALITGRGQGDPGVLHGQPGWPQHGAARLVGRGMRVEGRAVQLTEAEAAAALRPLRRPVADLPPVLWDDAAQGTPAPPDWLQAQLAASHLPPDVDAPALTQDDPHAA